MDGNIPVTRETYDELVAEMNHLKKVERPIVIEAITVARENGDLKENADYHAARDKQGHIEDRVKYLEDRIARAEIIEHDPGAAEHVTFGATVVIKNTKTGKEATWQLVSSDAVDPKAGKISSTSPIGKAVIGHKRGEIVEVQTPRGVNVFEILDYK
jgi:transcription elongation factor GreA